MKWLDRGLSYRVDVKPMHLALGLSEVQGPEHGGQPRHQGAVWITAGSIWPGK